MRTLLFDGEGDCLELLGVGLGLAEAGGCIALFLLFRLFGICSLFLKYGLVLLSVLNFSDVLLNLNHD